MAIGPVEHDIALHSIDNPKKIIGRLSFNLQFQHIQEMEVNIEKIVFHFTEKLEDNFYFSMQAQTPEGSVDSIAAKSQVLPPTNVDSLGQYIEFIGKNLPKLKFSTTYTYLSSSCIRVSLWHSPDLADPIIARRFSMDTNPCIERNEDKTFSGTCINQLDTEVLIDVESDPLFGECYIPFLKLLANEMTVLEPSSESTKTDIVANAKLQKTFSERLWNCGKMVGKITGSFIVSDPPFLRQMLCGAHTEDGFCFNSSNVLLSNPTFDKKLCNCFIVEEVPPEVS